jgi:hypothetical protein
MLGRARDLLVLGLVIFVPLGLLDAVVDEIGTVHSGTDSPLIIAAAVSFVSVQVVSTLLGEVFYSGAVSAMLAREGHPPPLPQFLRSLRWKRLIAADLIFSLVVGAGLVALVVPGVIFFTWFGLIAPVIEIEDRGLRAAFKRSRELVRGHFWKVLVILGSLTIASDAISTGATDLAHIAFGHGLLPAWAGETVGNVVAAPLYAVPAVLLTLKLSGRRLEV